MNWEWFVLAVVIIFLIVRVKKRGFFWKARDGSELTFKQTRERFYKGVEGISPRQQSATMLISFIPLFGGIFWGVGITFLSKTYWMMAILCGSLPLTIINFISVFQRYRFQKRAEKAMAEARELK